jgi:cyanophycinase-like exopeptidase
MAGPTVKPGTLTLMGSGELAPSMSKVHRAAAARVSGPLRAAFVDTPAAFEPNVDDIAAKAVAYLERHLRVPCEVVSYRPGAGAQSAEVRRCLAALRQANYIFAGPGSPTYAVRAWRNSPLFDAVAQRLADGAQIVLASAASIAAGAYTLPVYEIFKAGADLYWADGTDLLRPYGLKLAIVPHWNNKEGGAYDTSCCFMGQDRFGRLQAMLDGAAVVLGIDEHTACALDLGRGECTVTGLGHVTVRRAGEERPYGPGDTFGLDALRAQPGKATVPAALRAEVSDVGERAEHVAREMAAARRAIAAGRGGLADAAGCAFALSCAIDDAASAGVGEAQLAEGRTALTDLVRAWDGELARDSDDAVADVRPYVDLLVKVRTMLRAEGAWALADTIRDRLTELGITLEDSARETIWRSC